MPANVPTPSPEAASESPVRPSETVILLMGHTGAGKSHFINRAAERELAPVNHTLSTQDFSIHSYVVTNPEDPRFKVTLVETPGLDNADTRHSDLEIVRQISSWLEHCKDDVMLGGIIYLHDITAENLTLYADSQAWPLKYLNSPELQRRLVLTTTKWDMHFVASSKKKYNKRERKLSVMPTWRKLLSGGATLGRYGGCRPTAWGVIRPLLETNPLKVQDFREGFNKMRATLQANPPPKSRWGLMGLLKALFNLDRARNVGISKMSVKSSGRDIVINKESHIHSHVHVHTHTHTHTHIHVHVP